MRCPSPPFLEYLCHRHREDGVESVRERLEVELNTKRAELVLPAALAVIPQKCLRTCKQIQSAGTRITGKSCSGVNL
jgi:hypothetical protein